MPVGSNCRDVFAQNSKDVTKLMSRSPPWPPPWFSAIWSNQPRDGARPIRKMQYDVLTLALVKTTEGWRRLESGGDEPNDVESVYFDSSSQGDADKGTSEQYR